MLFFFPKVGYVILPSEGNNSYPQVIHPKGCCWKRRDADRAEDRCPWRCRTLGDFLDPVGTMITKNYCWWFRNVAKQLVGSLYLSHYSQGFIFYTSQVVVSNFFHRKFCPPENERMSPIKELWWKDISSSNIFQPSIVRDMLVLKGGRML